MISLFILRGFSPLESQEMTRTGAGKKSMNEEEEKPGDEEKTAWVEPGCFVDTRLGVSINYLGLSLRSDLYYRFPLVKNPGMLWRSTKMELGLQEYISPSFNRVALYVKVEPIALFDLVVYAGYDYLFTGLTGGIYDLAGPDAEFDSEARNDITPYTGYGPRIKATPSLKAALGPVAAVYSFTVDYHLYNTEGYYYDHETFCIHKGDDLIFTHDLKVLYQVGNFRFGTDWITLRVNSTGYASMKLAAMAIFIPEWEFLPQTLSPYGVVLAGTHLRDRYNKYKPYGALLLGLNSKIF